MKNKIIQFLLLLFICSCNFKQEEKIENIEPDSLTNQINIAVESTAYEFPEIKLPDNYYLDTITIYDQRSKANYEAYYPQSTLPEMKRFNQAIFQFVNDQIKYEQEFVDSYEGDTETDIIFSYQLKPVEIYSDSIVISISNIIDTYTEGGNHHNYTRCTFNYNLLDNEMIEFSDIFNLQSRNDSIEFIAYAEQFANDCKEWGWPYEFLDFSFSENGIYINPNLSWACISTRSLLPFKNTNRFLRYKSQKIIPKL